MATSEDSVMELLDSLNVKQPAKSKPKKSTSKHKLPKKATGDDILGFLEELDHKKEPDSEAPTTKEPEESVINSIQQEPRKEAAHNAGKEEDKLKETASEESGRREGEEEPSDTNTIASLASWWTRSSGGLWSKAQNTLQDAAAETIKQARQAEANIRDEQANFSFNSLQNRLTSMINTIIPPISRHEQLYIHIFHDMVGYPSIDKLLYEVFSYVMDQVEGGGDLNMVIQKGKERHRVGSDDKEHRSLNIVKCSLSDALKLAKASVENIPTLTEDQKPIDPNIRISELYISIQPVIPLAVQKVDPKSEDNQDPGESLYFVVYLLDKEHKIEISTTSQALPVEWAEWLDSGSKSLEDAAIDPREWVFGWVEDALNLAFGITAQKYVTTRMGLTRDHYLDDKKQNSN